MTILYAKSRGLARCALWLMIFGSVTLAWGSYRLHVPHVRVAAAPPIPLLLVIPLGSAVVIGASASGAMKDLEDTAALSLRRWRLAHTIGATLFAVALLAAATGYASGVADAASASRNLLGYTGLALLGACLLGTGLSWVLPIAYGLSAMAFAVNSASLAASWAWPVRPATSLLSWVWAVTFAVVGGVACVRFGARRSPAEDPRAAGY